MNNIECFKETINSFSAITGFGFAVSDRQNVLYITETFPENSSLNSRLALLSEEICKNNEYKEDISHDLPGIYGVPLKNGNDQVLGLMTFGNNENHKNKDEIKNLLENMAGVITDHWQSKAEVEKMTKEIDQSFEELYLYSKIADQVRTLRYTETMQKELIQDLLDIMRVDIAFTELKTHSEYNTFVSSDKAHKKVPDTKSFVQRLISKIPEGDIAEEDSYFIINNSINVPAFRNIHPEPFRFLVVKMRNNMDLEGWLGLVSFNLDEIFRQSELSLLVTMAEQIAVVLSNQDLYRDMERFVINVVKSLVQAIEAKDPYTRGHSERVNNYCMLIANELGLDEENKKALHWASILHDIGKIGIPEAILNKPTGLSDSEYGIIKTHPKKGAEILKHIEQLSDSIDGILFHHERYDGKGYAAGLKGSEIPLEARIIAVADTFDAITSNRAYRDANAHEEAMKIIREVKGTQLDPDIVAVIDKLYQEGQLNRTQE